MKIRTRLTLQNTFVIAAVFLLCMAMIYVISEKTRSRTFFHNLKSEAITKANLFLQNQVDARTMQSIYLNNRKFINEVEVAVYDNDFNMLYHDAIQNDIVKETREMIDEIVSDGEIEFYVDDYQAVGLVYTFEERDYVVTAAAYDGYGYNNLYGLGKTLLILFVIGLTLLFAACYYLAYSSLKPIRYIVREAEKISANNISSRLPVRNSKDELGELCMTFNDLLERLEISFDSQKMFVSNVSHELRTPLAALMAELDLALQKERTAGQYRNAIENALEDSRRMTKLIDGLLNLARADYQKGQISIQEIRLDELLLDTREFLLKAHPEYHIELIFEQEEADDDRLITVEGNSYLLNIAFSNLMENNCKYSEDHSSFVQISYSREAAVVRLSDDGRGFSKTDMENLFTLFYRGDKEGSVEGHGIGMALSQKVIRMHGGNISVHSEEGKGTTFIVEIPHMSF